MEWGCLCGGCWSTTGWCQILALLTQPVCHVIQKDQTIRSNPRVWSDTNNNQEFVKVLKLIFFYFWGGAEFSGVGIWGGLLELFGWLAEHFEEWLHCELSSFLLFIQTHRASPIHQSSWAYLERLFSLGICLLHLPQAFPKERQLIGQNYVALRVVALWCGL